MSMELNNDPEQGNDLGGTRGDASGVLPLVSVILPVFNNEATVARAIQSALGQDYANFEIVAVDDGSTDDSRKVVEEFGNAVRLLRQDHAGPSAARNNAIAESKGEFLAFLDADDEWLQGRVEKCVRPMLDDERVGMTYCLAINRDEGGGAAGDKETIRGEEYEASRVFPRILWPSAKQTTPGTTIRRSVFEETRGFPTEYCAWRDYALYIELRELTEVVEVAEPLVNVYTSETSFTRTVDEERSREAYFAIAERAFARRPDLYEPHRRTILADMYFMWGTRYQAAGDTTRERRHYRLSMGQRKTWRVARAWLRTFAPGWLIGAVR